MISYEQLGGILFVVFGAIWAVWQQNRHIMTTNINGKKDTDEKIEAAEKQIATLIIEKDALAKDLKLWADKYSAANEALNTSRAEKNAFENKADDLAKQVARLEDSLEVTKRNADNLRQSLDELRAALDKIQADNLNLLKSNKDLNERLDHAETRADELNRQLEQSRENERVALALADLREARLEEARLGNNAIWSNAHITIIATPDAAKLLETLAPQPDAMLQATQATPEAAE